MAELQMASELEAHRLAKFHARVDRAHAYRRLVTGG
jgi:hypothetical protein